MVTPDSRTAEAERLAQETIASLRKRAEESIRFAEAYGHEGYCIVSDGTQFSPSSRALPNGYHAWMLGNEFHVWDDIVEDFIGNYELAEDTDSLCPGLWTLMWDDGCLLAVHPDTEWTE